MTAEQKSLERGPKLQINWVEPKPRLSYGWKITFVIPDVQIGYHIDREGNQYPTHDEAAIDTTLQALAVCKPDQVVILGDLLDLPMFSSFRKYESTKRTTQLSIDKCTSFLGQVAISAGKSVPIHWIEGNHEARYNKFLSDNADVLVGLRATGNKKYPVNSLPFLCRCEDLSVTYHGAYPAGQVRINDNLVCVHGTIVSKASTAIRYLSQAERVSVIYGHTHRAELAYYTRADASGAPKTVMAASPGTLSRIDGNVPATNSGYDCDGFPQVGVLSVPNWQQGFAEVRSRDDDFSYQPYYINNGFCLYKDQEIQARCDVNGNILE